MIPLQQIQIKSPCDKSWAAMDGDDQKRYCEGCRKDVFNLSAMTSAAAQDLIDAHAGNLCVRVELKEDGGIQTLDAPPQRKRRYAPAFGWAVALIVAGIVSLPNTALAAKQHKHMAHKHHKRVTVVRYMSIVLPTAVQPTTTTATKQPITPPQPPAIMGGIAPSSPALMGKPSAPFPVFRGTRSHKTNTPAVNGVLIGDVAVPSKAPPRTDQPPAK